MTRARVVLVRHGESEWNAARIMQGHGGPGLTGRGVAQAAATARLLADAYPDAVALWRSDLVRVIETAAPAEEALGVPVHVDARLRELDLGAWTGLTREQAAAADADTFAAWARGEDVPAGGAESFTDLRQRVTGALADLASSALGAAAGDGPPTVLVFTHGGPVRVGVAAALGLPQGGHRSFAPVANCAVSVLELAVPVGGARAVLSAYNGTGHLVADGGAHPDRSSADDEAYA